MTTPARATSAAASVWALLRATHLGPSLVVTGIALALGGAARLDGLALLTLAGAVLSGRFSIGWGNDLLDRERDLAAGRLDKPIPAGQVTVEVVRVAVPAALAACAVLSVALGPAAGALHLVAVALAWSYNLGLKSTVASPLPYAAAFGLLPMVVAAAGTGRAPAWVVAAAALLGAGAHFINTLPDAAHDERTGVRGLPQRLGPRRSAVIGAVLIAVGAAVAGAGLGAVGRLGGGGVAALLAVLALVGGVLVVGLRSGTRLAFTLSMAASVVLVALLTSAGPLLG